MTHASSRPGESAPLVAVRKAALTGGSLLQELLGVRPFRREANMASRVRRS